MKHKLLEALRKSGVPKFEKLWKEQMVKDKQKKHRK